MAPAASWRSLRPEPIFFSSPHGGQVACEESGDPHGEPIFFFHGWPASRLQGAGFGPAAHALGFRIIALDRPGIGASTYHPGRRLLDWPPVVAEVARELGLHKFRVLGISGGGPYALATAWALPEMVETAVVVSGAPPLPRDLPAGSLFFAYQWLLALHRRYPSMLRHLFRAGRPLATWRPPHWLVMALLRLGPTADRAALSDPNVFEGSFGCYREAWSGSALGVARDGELYAEPWGFDPAEIHVPVRLWHGRADRSFAWPLAQALGESIPHCVIHLLENEGHYSLPIHHTRAILEDLTAPTAPRENA